MGPRPLATSGARADCFCDGNGRAQSEPSNQWLREILPYRDHRESALSSKL
jgi:hypothetical protein